MRSFFEPLARTLPATSTDVEHLCHVRLKPRIEIETIFRSSWGITPDLHAAFFLTVPPVRVANAQSW